MTSIEAGAPPPTKYGWVEVGVVCRRHRDLRYGTVYEHPRTGRLVARGLEGGGSVLAEGDCWSALAERLSDLLYVMTNRGVTIPGRRTYEQERAAILGGAE